MHEKILYNLQASAYENLIPEPGSFMVPDSFRENQGSEGHVCLLDFAMSALFRNITYKMLSAAIPFNKSLFKGMVK